MMANTKIEWATKTWNVFEGCTKCSPGCENCYALKDAWRFSHNPNPKISGPLQGVVQMVNHKPQWTGSVCVVEERMDQPLKIKAPQWIFVNSRSDTFHPSFGMEDISRVWSTMIEAHWHTFIVVTKRPQRAFDFINWYIGRNYPDEQAYLKAASHIILMATCCNQEEADRNIPMLLKTPAAMRGVSIEPMLGPISLNGYVSLNRKCFNAAGYTDALDWVVSGGESGRNARPVHPDWVRNLLSDCKSTRTPFFFKQWGEWCAHLQTDSPMPDSVHAKCIDREGNINFCGEGNTVVIHYGKKQAGNLLDGEKREQLPEVKHDQA